MTERSFDPGLDTPRDNEIGAGQPVPGSPVWEDARNRERVNAEQRDAEFAAAASASLSEDSHEGDRESSADEKRDERGNDSTKNRTTTKRGNGRTGR